MTSALLSILLSVFVCFHINGCCGCWVYNPIISTGLGDRVGTILALSALGRLHDTEIHMVWCTNPMQATITNPKHLRYIPKWTGWTYDLNRTRELLQFPRNVLFTPPPSNCSIVSIFDGGHNGMHQTSTLYGKFLHMGERQHTHSQYVRAYKRAGAELSAAKEETPYMVVHMRCKDDNTCAHDEESFCTPHAVRMLMTTGLDLKVVTNSPACTLHWLGESMSDFIQQNTTTAAEDMRLLLGAAAIIQHASEGWSSFSSVPAMAKGIPLLNTYSGEGHRYDIFQTQGRVPAEFYRCRQLQRFFDIVWASLLP